MKEMRHGEEILLGKPEFGTARVCKPKHGNLGKDFDVAIKTKRMQFFSVALTGVLGLLKKLLPL